MTTMRERIAIAICDETSGGEGVAAKGVHPCECKDCGSTGCVDMLKLADVVLACLVEPTPEMMAAINRNLPPGWVVGFLDHYGKVIQSARDERVKE